MKNSITNSISKIAVARQFSRAKESYNENALLQKEIGYRLLDRLEIETIQPKMILDLGAGTGYFSQPLLQKYSNIKLISLDIAQGMLEHAKMNFDLAQFTSAPWFVVGDAEQLPIQNHSIDLVFSNCTLQWCTNLPQLLNEIMRVLSPNGLFIFSTFGPDTLKELRNCIQKIDQTRALHPFLDMHDIGDMLLHAGFVNPVVDVEMFALLYNQFQELRMDLKKIGASYPSKSAFNRDFTSSNILKEYEQFRNNEQLLPATFEVIFGHAMGGEKEIKNFSQKKIAARHQEES